MKLNLKRPYKSIEALSVELPALTIITGENGAGKTHLLKAIQYDYAEVEGILKEEVKYYTWSDLLPEHELSVMPRKTSVPNNSNVLISILSAIRHDIIKALDTDPRFVIDAQIDRERLLDSYTDSAAPFAELPKSSQVAFDIFMQLRRGYYLEYLSYEKRNLFTNLEFIDNEIKKTFNIIGRNLFLEKGENGESVIKVESHRLALYNIIKSYKNYFNISHKEIADKYFLTEVVIDPLKGSLTQLFASYIQQRELNDLNELRFNRGTAAHFYDNDSFLLIYGMPPWVVLNQILEKTSLNFRVKAPSEDASRPVEVILEQLGTGIEIKFQDLSSGEQVLVALAQYLFLSRYNKQPTSMPKLVLLDEIDAPLHPSVVVDMLRIITNDMVAQANLNVILVTHSPSTVALAPEKALFVLEKSDKNLRKVSRDEAIHVLTAGVPVLSVKLENRRQVFVESEYDVQYYEKIALLLKPHLNPEISFIFIGSGTGGNSSCDQVKALVKGLVDAGSHTVFGIIDWDTHNNGNERVRVLGQGQRYSIENYLFDPIAVAILVYQLNIVGRETLLLEPEQTFADLRGFDDERLQKVANNILHWLDFQTDMAQVSRACVYMNGRTITVPVNYLEMQGHDLEAHLINKSPEFRRFNKKNSLKMEIIHKVFNELPGFIPKDFIDLLRGIQP